MKRARVAVYVLVCLVGACYAVTLLEAAFAPVCP